MADKDKLRELQQTMGSVGWAVLRDFLTSQKEADMVVLAAPKRTLPDDFYRGRIDVMLWFLEALPRQVEEGLRDVSATSGAQDNPGDQLDVGHPYTDLESQPFMEGEDMR